MKVTIGALDHINYANEWDHLCFIFEISFNYPCNYAWWLLEHCCLAGPYITYTRVRNTYITCDNNITDISTVQGHLPIRIIILPKISKWTLLTQNINCSDISHECVLFYNHNSTIRWYFTIRRWIHFLRNAYISIWYDSSVRNWRRLIRLYY